MAKSPPAKAPATVKVVLLAAGESRRLGGGPAKPWRHLAGRPVLSHALDAFDADPRIGGGVVVVAGEAMEEARKHLPGPDWTLAEGGAERSASARNGLEALAGAGDAPDLVLIHDAARPFVPPAVLDRVIGALAGGAGAAIPALPPADSLKKVAGGKVAGRVDRDGVERVQTPQGFAFSLILDLHRQAGAGGGSAPATDDSSLAEDAGVEVRVVEGDPVLAKITTQADLALAERLALSAAGAGAEGETRMATGFDVHRFGRGPGPVLLCGVAVEHEHGLEAHSDGDVGLHALTDAVLGLMADGDIGAHFPPTDEKWKDADSAVFLAEAASRLKAAGGAILHADATIIAETPKVGPHRAAMRERVARILGIDAERVSVKATTTEGLGITGEGKGIAAQAAVTAHFTEPEGA